MPTLRHGVPATLQTPWHTVAALYLTDDMTLVRLFWTTADAEAWMRGIGATCRANPESGIDVFHPDTPDTPSHWIGPVEVGGTNPYLPYLAAPTTTPDLVGLQEHLSRTGHSATTCVRPDGRREVSVWAPHGVEGRTFLCADTDAEVGVLVTRLRALYPEVTR